MSAVGPVSALEHARGVGDAEILVFQPTEQTFCGPNRVAETVLGELTVLR